MTEPAAVFVSNLSTVFISHDHLCLTLSH